MLHYLINEELFGKPVLLYEGAIPQEIMAGVFVDYTLFELRVMIWRLVQVALISDNTCFGEPSERDGLLHECNRLEELLEAAWLLTHEKKQAPKKA